MHSAAKAYNDVAQATLGPRELEASLLVKAAAKLQTVKDQWEHKSPALDEALHYNRKLWTIFATSVTNPDSPLPKPVRENIASLAVFIFNRTLEAETAPAPDKLSALIDINRQIAAGLRASTAASSPNG
ncbi:hypothetical protein MNBD_ALPHA09-712 [hydrothermal vent metagenome]|uniref:Flagellar protein FlaF n=1 Tax=hydrothermal vent metagenome TaxID=652676 RepID=A0A3B0TAD7_9ZZZZ